MPGDHFMALIKFSSGIECPRHSNVPWNVPKGVRTKGAGSYAYRLAPLLIFSFGILMIDIHEIFFSAKILEISIEFRCCNPCCILARCILVIDDRFEEILYRSRADFAFRTIFHSLLKKVMENCWTKKLSRDIFLDCIPVLRLHYQMWNIFMVSP